MILSAIHYMVLLCACINIIAVELTKDCGGIIHEVIIVIGFFFFWGVLHLGLSADNHK